MLTGSSRGSRHKLHKGGLGSFTVSQSSTRVPLSFYYTRTCSVLKLPGGIFFYFTFGQPHFRTRYMVPDSHPQYNTSLEVRTLGEEEDSFHYFAYILRKEG
jgi:hypothetical protein